MDKPCKLCDKKRFANTSWCYSHYREREKQKKEEKAQLKKERKEATKGFQKNLRRLVHKKTWDLMSKYIRTKDANADGMVQCYTCGTWKHYKEMDAGHYKHDRLDFDERNLKPQCSRCNKYHQGQLDEYAHNLIRDFGIEWFDQLVRDAWAHPGYSVEEMLKIQIELKEKLSKINI